MTGETERLERLVANLLDLSRLEAGALIARLDWCAPAEIAAGAVDAAEPVLGGLDVEIAVPADLPLVRADPVLCERILVNLLHNAVRHGPAAGGASPAGRRPGRAARRRRGPGPGRGAGERAFRPLRRRPAHRRHRHRPRAVPRARRGPGRPCEHEPAGPGAPSSSTWPWPRSPQVTG